jgi:hypothetical protein
MPQELQAHVELARRGTYDPKGLGPIRDGPYPPTTHTSEVLESII